MIGVRAGHVSELGAILLSVSTAVVVADAQLPLRLDVKQLSVVTDQERVPTRQS
ncbi:hypothetical protein [Rhodococcus sp. IEGM 1379]|uniref:hypothetical protein n=1 Tax=Rhodococcus sp. IEGM 1379 TaxID=3047086 RepID=UPI0024B84AF2|nr:hypothetical protein [Rhodococcus sp. IEGM 1379]MDI9916073.1 hypothetical protein [Rhodococcus sp. IEGM 1379]